MTPAMDAAEPFDRALRRLRHARAMTTLGAADFLHRAIVDELGTRVAEVAAETGRRFDRVLDLGGPVAIWPETTRLALTPGRDVAIVADEDRLPLAPASFDLVVSAGSLATVNDLPGALAQIRRALAPGGLFVAGFAGGMTLADMRADLIAAEAAATGGAAARTHPMVDAQAAAGLLQRAGFDRPVVDLDRLTVRYGSLFALFDDLAAMGARSVLAERRPLRRAVLADAAARFAARAGPDGKTAVMVDIVYMSGWAP